MKDAGGKEIPISHPNARCTIASSALANYSDKAEVPEGVETRVITYSGRDSDTMPPVWVAKNSDHGVVIGACIVSAATATEVGRHRCKAGAMGQCALHSRCTGRLHEGPVRLFRQ
jgi:phosphoenolpyruvate carboxykinase (GTP)